MTANLLTLNSSKTEFLLIGLRKQLDNMHNSSLNTTHSARNLGFIFDEHLTFSDQISAVFKASYYHIKQLCCICPSLNSTAACTIATSIVHSKLNYCNSLYYNLSKSQITRLQQMQNSLAHAVVKATKSCHITAILPMLSSLAQNNGTHPMQTRLSLTDKVLTTTQPPYLHSVRFVQPGRTRSSSVITLARPTSSSLRYPRSFRYASQCLWNQLLSSLRQPHSSLSASYLPVHASTTSHSINSPLSPSITPSVFHSRLKSGKSFHISFPP